MNTYSISAMPSLKSNSKISIFLVLWIGLVSGVSGAAITLTDTFEYRTGFAGQITPADTIDFTDVDGILSDVKFGINPADGTQSDLTGKDFSTTAGFTQALNERCVALLPRPGIHGCQPVRGSRATGAGTDAF